MTSNPVTLDVQLACEYPGHPLLVALAIMRVFPSLNDATSTGGTFTKAAECGDVPGAGCAIRVGIRLLEAIRDGLPVAMAPVYADGLWVDYIGHQDSYRDRIVPGSHKARPFVREFLDRAAAWDFGPTPEPE